MMVERKALSTRKRFEILKRDGFRCVYCGATPLGSLLHVDHVVAVANGGTNDPANLVSACQSCNLGKSSISLADRKAPTPDAAEAKERADQIRRYVAAQRSLATAKNEVVAAVVDHWRLRIPDEEPHYSLSSHAPAMLEKHALSDVFRAIDIVAGWVDRNEGGPAAVERVKYLHGVLRRFAEG